MHIKARKTGLPHSSILISASALVAMMALLGVSKTYAHLLSGRVVLWTCSSLPFLFCSATEVTGAQPCLDLPSEKLHQFFWVFLIFKLCHNLAKHFIIHSSSHSQCQKHVEVGDFLGGQVVKTSLPNAGVPVSP